MEKEVLDNAVQMRIDVHHSQIGRNGDPCYRLYINNELFSERCYRFECDTYLTEQLFINREPGTYRIHVEAVGGFTYKLRNLRCVFGEAQVLNNEVFKL